MTKLWTIGINQIEAPEQLRESLQEAADMLRNGETVAFPTETVYGLGANAAMTEAVRGIYAAKGRPSDNPLIVHIAERSQLEAFTAHVVDEPIERLMTKFWPGPLTIILPVKPNTLSPLVTAGLSTVGVRMPDHPIARELIRLADCPVAAPSANSSGKPSPTCAAHVREDLDGRIGGIVDGGSAGVGLESTVVEWSQGALHILRPGGITAEALREALPGVIVHAPAAGGEAEAEAALSAKTPRAPGMKYRHYAPRGRMWLVDGADEAAVTAAMRRELAAAKAQGERTGVLTFEERSALYEEADLTVVCGRLSEPQTIAQGLFAALRKFDQDGVTFILAESCPEQGIGAAIMNRLRKAAGNHILHVPNE